jgi:hypothetical protein
LKLHWRYDGKSASIRVFCLYLREALLQPETKSRRLAANFFETGNYNSSEPLQTGFSELRAKFSEILYRTSFLVPRTGKSALRVAENNLANDTLSSN